MNKSYQRVITTKKNLLDKIPQANSKRKSDCETINSILLTEPRIESIRKELQALLKVVEFEVEKKVVDVKSFRLKSNQHWANSPSSLSDIFWHLSSVCNFSCEFCYEKGNPPGFPIQNTIRMANEKEIYTRLKYYNPITKRGIFTVRTAINEPFVNRNAIKYLKSMREKSPNELISFVTNGAYLDEKVVKEFKTLQPLFFNLSIYSTDTSIRRGILKDFRGDKAVNAVQLLAKYEVPFMSNLVMWPSISLGDMEKTIKYVSDMNAVVMRICLGGYSEYLPGEWKRFDTGKFWNKVVKHVEKIRHKYKIPLLIEPNTYVNNSTEAIISGVIHNSPAFFSGLLKGDLILKLNGELINSKMHFLSQIRRISGSNVQNFRPPGVIDISNESNNLLDESVELDIKRNEKIIKVKLSRYAPKAMKTYPYNKIAHFNDFMYGLVITDCLKYSSLLEARRLMKKYNSNNVLILSSALIKPMLLKMLKITDAFSGFNTFIRVPKNNYFGGTINIGDLLVVDDYISAIEEFKKENKADPDLVLIPSSPFSSSPWGRDLTGTPWTEIERKTNVKVDLISTSTITF